MLCPKCKSDKSEVTKSPRKTESLNLRVRHCSKCHHAWVTVEITYVEYEELKKKTPD